MLITRKNDVLVLGESPKQGLDDTRNTKKTAEAKYSVNITKSKKKICLILYYNGRDSFLYASGMKIYQFKAKDSEIKPYPLCLGDILNDFTVDNIKNRVKWIYV